MQVLGWGRFGPKEVLILFCVPSNRYQNWISKGSNSVKKGCIAAENF